MREWNRPYIPFSLGNKFYILEAVAVLREKEAVIHISIGSLD